MNKPNKKDFNEQDIYKYVTLLEEYIAYLEERMKNFEVEILGIEIRNTRLKNEKDDLEAEIRRLKEYPIGGNSILDEMAIDWLRDDSNWKIIKQMALKQN